MLKIVHLFHKIKMTMKKLDNSVLELIQGKEIYVQLEWKIVASFQFGVFRTLMEASCENIKCVIKFTVRYFTT